MVLDKIAASVIGAFGGYKQKKELRRANDRARDRGDQILGVWDPFDPNRGGGEFARLREMGGLFGIRRDYMDKLLENAQGAFKGARQDARRGAYGARKTARATGEQLKADAAQQLQARGLYGSSIGQQAASGIGYRTGQALSDIDMQLGSLLGEIDMEESAVMDQLLRGNLALEEANAQQMMAYIVGNVGHGPGDSSMFFQQDIRTPQTSPFDVGAGVQTAMDIFKDLF